MCTISFIPADNRVFITHSRDENKRRSRAIPPKEYTINGTRLLFPRDGDAGGSWIACNRNGAAAVLLNGAFTKHVYQPPYKKSRGLAFLDIATAADLLTGYRTTDLEGIEPFTVILWNNNALYECRWDGVQKHISMPDPRLPHTWSSVTLYDESVIAIRKKWFCEWLQRSAGPSMEAVIAFHLSAGDGDPKNDLLMNRGEVFTVSITAMEITKGYTAMNYLDLKDNTRTLQYCNFTQAPALPQ